MVKKLYGFIKLYGSVCAPGRQKRGSIDQKKGDLVLWQSMFSFLLTTIASYVVCILSNTVPSF